MLRKLKGMPRAGRFKKVLTLLRHIEIAAPDCVEVGE